jgi:hypothetical protein
MEEENSGGRVWVDGGGEEWGKRKDGLGKSRAELEKGRRGRRKREGWRRKKKEDWRRRGGRERKGG